MYTPVLEVLSVIHWISGNIIIAVLDQLTESDVVVYGRIALAHIKGCGTSGRAYIGTCRSYGRCIRCSKTSCVGSNVTQCPYKRFIKVALMGSKRSDEILIQCIGGAGFRYIARYLSRSQRTAAFVGAVCVFGVDLSSGIIKGDVIVERCLIVIRVVQQRINNLIRTGEQITDRKLKGLCGYIAGSRSINVIKELSGSYT